MSGYSYSRISDNYPDDMRWHRFDEMYEGRGCENEWAIGNDFSYFRIEDCSSCGSELDCPHIDEWREFCAKDFINSVKFVDGKMRGYCEQWAYGYCDECEFADTCPQYNDDE